MIRMLCAVLFLCALPAPAARADEAGAYVVLELEEAPLRRQRLLDLSEQMARALRGAAPAIAAADASSDDEAARIRVQSPAQSAIARQEIEAALAFYGMQNQVTLDADAEGRITARFTEDGWRAELQQTQAQSLEIIRRRLDPAASRGIILESRADGRIFVRDPSESDPERLRTRIGVTGALTFHLVLDEFDALSDEPLPNDAMRAPAHASASSQAPEIVDRAALMTGERLVRADPTEDIQTGMMVLSFQFDASGARIFCGVTRKHVGRRFAVLLDGRVLTAPRINEAICGGSGQISGNFDAASASELAILLRSGALPAPLRIVEQGVGAR